MTEYKLTVGLDATLAVQNLNGSYNYFKPSIAVEVSVGETDDLTILNDKFNEVYEKVIGPNFAAVINELLTSNVESDIEQKGDNSCSCDGDCNCNNESCDCTDKNCTCNGKSLEIAPKPEANGDNLPKEEWE